MKCWRVKYGVRKAIIIAENQSDALMIAARIFKFRTGAISIIHVPLKVIRNEDKSHERNRNSLCQ